VQQPSPPIWVGGKGGPKLLDLVARRADGWNFGWMATPEDYTPKLDRLRQACDRHGRDPGDIALSLGLYTLVGEGEADLRRRFERLRESAPPGVLHAATVDEYRPGRLVGTVEQVREQLAGWDEVGVRLVVACLGAVPFSVTEPDDLGALDMLAAAVP
jgi:alkanesulfonate monooxygenase SsuD/methylene tetrahydromethanopterin reductase-like flavin-dependent oxidoreductase (luciferase family)